MVIGHNGKIRKMKAMNEFNPINIVNKLIEFDLITEKQMQTIIDKNRKRVSLNEKEHKA